MSKEKIWWRRYSVLYYESNYITKYYFPGCWATDDKTESPADFFFVCVWKVTGSKTIHVKERMNIRVGSQRSASKMMLGLSP